MLQWHLEGSLQAMRVCSPGLSSFRLPHSRYVWNVCITISQPKGGDKISIPLSGIPTGSVNPALGAANDLSVQETCFWPRRTQLRWQTAGSTRAFGRSSGCQHEGCMSSPYIHAERDRLARNPHPQDDPIRLRASRHPCVHRLGWARTGRTVAQGGVRPRPVNATVLLPFSTGPACVWKFRRSSSGGSCVSPKDEDRSQTRSTDHQPPGGGRTMLASRRP